MTQTETEKEKPIRVLVVDDESLARRRMRALLAGVSDVMLLGECETGAQAVTAIRELEPDLVFLDVQMPELDGFDVIAAVGADKMPPVIFVTAFDDYAVNGVPQAVLIDRQGMVRMIRYDDEKTAPALEAEIKKLLAEK